MNQCQMPAPQDRRRLWLVVAGRAHGLFAPGRDQKLPAHRAARGHAHGSKHQVPPGAIA